MARRYDIEGTRNFLWASVSLFLLGVWCVKDGWFPSESVLARHPPGTLEHDRFYLFNKSLAIISFAISAICGLIHRKVR